MTNIYDKKANNQHGRGNILTIAVLVLLTSYHSKSNLNKKLKKKVNLIV